jgi:hypothetical protein
LGIRDRIRSALLRFADRVDPPLRIDPAWEVVALPLPGGSSPVIDRITYAGPDLWVLGTISVRGQGERRFACVDRGRGYELVADMPSGIGIDVWPISRTDLWFAGYGGSAAHYDGSRWSRFVWPKYYFDFLHVYARDASDVWLKTAGELVHFDGANFSVVAAPELLRDTWSVVWGAEEDVYILLNNEKESGFAKRDREGRWSRTMLGFGGATLIGGVANDMWIMSSAEGGWHFDGTTWSRHATGKGRFWAMHAEATCAYIAGDDGAVGRWDGARWTVSSMGSDRLMSICRQRDGRLVVGGTQLYREREPYSPK